MTTLPTIEGATDGAVDSVSADEIDESISEGNGGGITGLGYTMAGGRGGGRAWPYPVCCT